MKHEDYYVNYCILFYHYTYIFILIFLVITNISTEFLSSAYNSRLNLEE